jgi:hypothetical protein
VVAVTGLYVCVCAAAFHFQRSLLYFPKRSALGIGDQTIVVRSDGDVKAIASFRPGNRGTNEG